MYDYNKPAKDILLDLIFFSNGIRFRSDIVSFGLPQVLDQRPDIDSDANTFIPLSVNPDYDDRYEGNSGLLYRRGTLEDVVPREEGLVTTPDYPFTTIDLLPAINAHYGTQIESTDIIDQTYVSAADPLNVVFDPHALVWQGTSVVNLQMMAVTSLNGFFEYAIPG